MFYPLNFTNRTVTASLLALGLLTITPNTIAQTRLDGVVQENNGLWSHAPDEIKVFHGDEFKKAHKVAISVFNVAFPNKNTFTANAKGTSGGWGTSHEASMETSISGVDLSTQQRITDKAYQLFVEQLKSAGYDVVSQAELTRLAPEFSKWDARPNFSQGRYGSYVAPTGLPLYFLPGDESKRDISGMFGELNSIVSRGVDSTQAYKRSAYIANEGGIGIIAVTLVMDYGVYSTTGERRSFGGLSKVGFKPGLTIGAGNLTDSGSLLEFWSPNSGGFPAAAYLQIPVRSEIPFWTADGFKDLPDLNVKGLTIKEASIVADPVKFEAAANEVSAIAIPKLIKIMTDGR